MNISHDGVTVRFKTEPESLFELEKSGAKPNTVRILDVYEADQIRRKPPTKIIIQYQQEIFLRTITDIHLNYNVLGKVIAIFSWSNEIVRDTYAHTKSLNETVAEIGPATERPSPDTNFVAIGISKQMFDTLQNNFSGRTMNSVVQELYETYLYKLAEEVGPLHD